MFDGDTIFVLATGHIPLPEGKTPFGPGIIEALNQLGVAAADVLSRAVIHAVLSAETVGPFLSFRDKYPDSLLER